MPISAPVALFSALCLALAAFARLFRPGARCFVNASRPGEHWALAFESGGRMIIALWLDREAKPQRVKLDSAFADTYDLMGNRIEGGEVVLSDSPIFMVAKTILKASALRRVLESALSPR